MPEFLFSNFGQSTLSAAIDAADTIIPLEPSSVGRFPQPGVGQVFALLLADGRNEPEILWCTSNPLNGLLVVERGMEGTPAQHWDQGTSVLHTHTAASLEWFVTGGQITWKTELEASLAALQASIATVDARVTANGAADTAQRTYLTSQIEANSAAITENYSVVSDYFLAQSNLNTTLLATVSSTEASVNVFLQAQANNNSATSTRLTTLEANFGSVFALAQENFQAIANTDSALSVLQVDLNAKIAGHTSQISALSSALANNYEVLSTVQTTLQASFNTLSASVTTISLAQAGLDGRLAATYGVKVSAGNVFAGFTLLSSTGSPTTISQMIIEVQRLIIKSPTGVWQPFVFDTGTGTAYLQNIVVDGAYIKDLTVASIKILGGAITTPKIATNNVTLPHIFDTAPFITLNGGYQTIASFGFTPVGGRVRIDTAVGVSLLSGTQPNVAFELRDGGGNLIDTWYGSHLAFITYPSDDFVTPGVAASWTLSALLASGGPTRADRVKIIVTDFKSEA